MSSKRRKISRRGGVKKQNYTGLSLLVFGALLFYLFYSERFSILKVPHKINYEVVNGLEMPFVADSSYLVWCNKGRYIYNYSPKDKQSLWVAYTLSAKDVKNKKVKRGNDFKPSPQVLARRWQTAYKQDYRGSSYDRGHLLPSRDRVGSREENEATFYFSNISPQRQNLNRRGWMLLERYVRDVAKTYGTTYITVGGVFNKNKSYIGTGKVTIPKSFFKVILVKDGGKYRSLGFIMPNSETVKENYMKYAVSVNEVEKLTGYDFFTHLPNSIEEKCENKKKKLKVN
ncbi:MAG: DNA/RNA non-specific endonuclease [Bacteroidetes bacterium]|nr:DNA/RNA non-specific endonuclease [Bacteroidota bacterium]